MNDIQFTPNEKLKLLQNILILEQEERRDIAARLHKLKNALTTVSYPMMQLSKSEANIEHVQEIRKIINDFLAETRKINTSIAPLMVYLSEINYGIRQFITETKSANEEIEIELNSSQREFKGLDKIKEIGVYKICIEILEYLLISTSRSITVSMELEKNHLKIEISGFYFKKHTRNNKQKGKLNQIKGRLILHNAKIHPATNWKDLFKFKAIVK